MPALFQDVNADLLPTGPRMFRFSFSMKFRSTQPEDLPRIQEFLCRVYGTGPEDPLLGSAHMHWKYYEPHPFWEGSRSYVLEDQNGIVAHIAATPGELQTEKGRKRCAHFIDWAADPSSMGMGAAILRRIGRMTPYTFCIGGSPDNRRLLPVFGFKPVNDCYVLARPLHPFRQARKHQWRNWKLPARLVRNTAWSLSPALEPRRWRARSATIDELPAAAWNTESENTVSRVRTPDWLHYFLASRTTEFRLLALENEGRIEGGALICFTPGQARIADLWIRDAGTERLAGALSALLGALRPMPVEEAVCAASTPVMLEASRMCGFRPIHRDPIMAYPAAPEGGPVEAPLAADDAAFLHHRLPQYLT